MDFPRKDGNKKYGQSQRMGIPKYNTPKDHNNCTDIGFVILEFTFRCICAYLQDYSSLWFLTFGRHSIENSSPEKHIHKHTQYFAYNLKEAINS